MSAGAAPFGLEPPSLAPGRRGERRASSTPRPSGRSGAEGWESRSDNSCFAGRELTGRVLMTVAAGRVAYRQRELRDRGSP